MIVYRSNKIGFLDAVHTGVIDVAIEEAFTNKLGRRTSPKEVESWWNSLNYVALTISDPDIPMDAGVFIECQIPQTNKRIDFILTGIGDNDKSNIVIIELKQWTNAEKTEKDGIVVTALGRGLRETSHPSYQAWTYAALLEDYSEVVQEEGVKLSPCAFLHNYTDDDVIRHEFYSNHIQKAPVFLKRDRADLAKFIKRFIRKGDEGAIMYRIDNGKIRPSKQLADALSSMLKGNTEFTLIDEQKLVYESARNLASEAYDDFYKKKVMIVEGGPGTGKSVVAINLLVNLTKQGLLTQYVTKNAAPRAVYRSKLTGTITRGRYDALFQGSGVYRDVDCDKFDALIIDEAHRLNEKSGLFQNLGENQIKEIINATKCAIFFIDENQQIHIKDIGTKDEIVKWADDQGADLSFYELPSQFRCNGSDGYLAFLDNALNIRQTANTNLDGINFDFRVFDSPNALYDAIEEKNKKDNKSRVVAGYCWDWKSKKDKSIMDIEFPEYNFSRQWNLDTDGSLWIMQPNSIEQIGCIHTCQGLEVSYIGVIIGKDLVVRNGEIITDPYARSKQDRSVFGFKSMMKKDPESTKIKLDILIKNTYRTLMTRGMKGCYVYCVDDETNEYFKGLAI